jgi:murein DD-endopeptidase MepM/ murein hydrolase activator NlpD
VHGAAPDSKVPNSLLPLKSTATRTAGAHFHGPLVGFLRLNRSVLAITAFAFAFAAIGINELPGQAAAQEAVGQPTGLQHVSVSTAATQSVGVNRDAFAVTTRTAVQWPIDPSTPVGDGFGYRAAPCAGCSTFHQGTDFGPGFGTPIAAIADGVVTGVGNPSGDLGVHAIIRHSIDGVVFSSVYGHMEYGSMHLVVGQTVTRGQLVGLVGGTGESTGPHLHFGILDASGKPINPLTWIRRNANVPFVPAG